MEKILKSYLRKLTNLTGNNRSLLLLRLSASQDLDLHDLDFLKSEPSFHIISSLIAGEKKTGVCSVMDSRDGNVNNISRQLKKIWRRDNFIFDERGARDLYIGWPFVRGKFVDGTIIRCPLLFFPVSLQVSADDEWEVVRREEEPVSFNKSFLLAYAHYNNIQLDEELPETSFEEFDTDVQVFKTSLYQLLKDSQLEINFNQDLFQNQLRQFTTFKKADYESQFKNGELMLYPESVLGIFPQAGSFLVPDYEELMAQSEYQDLEDFFLDKTIAEDRAEADRFHFIKKVKEEQTFTPFKLDASQENAVKAVKKGNSIVVQGPPGTGKSQLICNLLSDFIARGKNVLLVCQKKAALDVVHERLKEKEVADFVGLVHDFKNDRKSIYQQIASQIERLDEYKYKNNSLDSIVLEREFLKASRQIDKIAEELEDFKEALFDQSEAGVSIKELYLTSDPEKPHIALQQEYKYFPIEQVHQFENKIRAWVPYARRFLTKTYLWRDRVSFRLFKASDKKQIMKLLDDIPLYQAEVAEKLRQVIGAPLDFDDCEWVAGKEDKLKELLALLEDEEVYKNLKYFYNRSTDTDWLMLRQNKIQTCFRDGVERTLQASQLSEFESALQRAYKASTHPLRWFFWRWFSRDKYFVKRVFVSNGLDWNAEGFKILRNRLDNRMNLEHNYSRIKDAEWLRNAPDELEQESFERWLDGQQAALFAKDSLKDLRSLREFLNIPDLNYEELKDKLLKVADIVREVPGKKEEWLKFFTSTQLSKVLYDYEHALNLKGIVKKDFDSLVELDRLKAELSTIEKEVLEKLYDEDEEKTPESVIQLFNNSLRLEWVDHIETKYPVLTSVSSLRMEQLEQELRSAIKEKLEISKDILLLRTRERTYKNVEFNRLNNLVTYRDLYHQVTKKKRIWPVRKVIKSFSEDLFKVVPCWMASPESVSAIFPMEQLFDVVIFDEASQCFAERGIPAMYRGRQVVVAGDDRQLSPNDLYNVRYEEEEQDDTPDLEIDSLLDLCKKYLMEVRLKGHYRSRSLDLISFSNKHFYNNNLSLLPHYEDAVENEPSIRYIKTEGVWEYSSNRVEAEKVVELVAKLIKEGTESIGVVTFNFRQQELINDLLEEASVERRFLVPSSVFVKNIENVQGDERDIIIFSIGYAPDKNGKLVMHFGSLNMDKGENRLNVAITRARKMIYVVSSILPQQLDTQNAKHEGPKLFKKYLEYAWNVSEGNFKPVPESSEAYNADWLLKNKLKGLTFDFDLEEELPFTDLTVKKKDQYKGLIMTDDNIYHQSISVKDQHAYTPMTMKSKKWQLIRLFSRNYWMNKDEMREKIMKKFSDLS